LSETALIPPTIPTAPLALRLFRLSACLLFATSLIFGQALNLALASPARARVVAPDSFADLAAAVLPGVVNVNITKTVKEHDPRTEEFLKRFAPDSDKPEGPQRRTGGGTGFIIDADGTIVTNNHVIEDADDITVKLNNGEEYHAKLVGADPKTDLAVLRIKSKKKLPALKFGDSDASRVGEWVLTIGSPFGLGGTVTAGIISAYNRDINAGLYDDYIQTDSPINPGNSGGPMFNMAGQVIGINTAIFSPSGANSGIGFAIPSNLAKRIVAQLRARGAVSRGWFGVAFQPLTAELAEGLGLAEAKGALVASVTDGGPADKAGIKSGDVVLKYNGVAVDQKHRLPVMVADTQIGKRVPVVISHKSALKTLVVVITERKEQEEAAGDNGAKQAPAKPSPAGLVILGMTLEPLTDELRDKLDLGKGVKGALVTDVARDSTAHDKGVFKGDVIVAVAQEEVAKPKDVADRVAGARKGGLTYVLFRILRGGNYSHIALNVSEK
jgi:serine protease Do